MTKQEEIWEVIDEYTNDECLYPEKACARCSKEGYCASGNDAFTCLMKRLGEIGVVLKVQRELPAIGTSDNFGKTVAHLTQIDMLKAGYCAVEELI